MMRRALAVFFALWGGACQSKPLSSSSLSSVIELSDARTAGQLERGFHPLEEHAWRWTAGKFAARLKPPLEAESRGARLQLKLYVAPSLIARNGEVTLSCAINSVPMPPEVWSQPGSYVLERDVTPIAGDTALLECATAKVVPPGPVDQRELGVIVSSIRLDERVIKR